MSLNVLSTTCKFFSNTQVYYNKFLFFLKNKTQRNYFDKFVLTCYCSTNYSIIFKVFATAESCHSFVMVFYVILAICLGLSQCSFYFQLVVLSPISNYVLLLLRTAQLSCTNYSKVQPKIVPFPATMSLLVCLHLFLTSRF